MNDVLNRAMRLLAQRDHSEMELRRKLAAQDVSDAEIEQSIAYCHEYHWLDDAGFAARYVRQRSRKGYGPQRIQQELSTKGVAQEHIRLALQQDDIDWAPLARKTLHKRFGDAPPGSWQERAKMQRFLLYRGFFQEDIQSAFSDSID